MDPSKLQDLKDELDAGHPTTGAYSADRDTAADQINAINRTKPRNSMTGDEVFQATDATEFTGLSADNRQLWMAFCARDNLDPYGTANVALVTDIFSGGTTLTNLQSLRVANCSRADELGFGSVGPADIEDARNL